MHACSLAPFIAAGLSSGIPDANAKAYPSRSWGQWPSSTSNTPSATGKLPVVDLGYGLWQATINETGGYYNFSNIRFARAPVGELRFAKPQPPLQNRSTVNDGQDGRVCPQGTPSWTKERGLFVKQYLSDPNNITDFENVPPPGVVPAATPPGQGNGFVTEDCLFLDVIVPISIYDQANKRAAPSGYGGYGGHEGQRPDRAKGAPILVRSFGGGFYLGSKNSEGDPAGLVGQSISNAASAPGMIYVGINYRLGALGWLAGPSFNLEGGQSNAGLYDQRLAFEWIQQHIHLFGGDPDRVTVSGASAGASSTMLHITAYGGKGAGKTAPFRQAFPQSPAININAYNWLQEATYKKFLQATNVSTLVELRSLSSEEVIAANELTIWQAQYGSSGGYGPVIDGDFVPAPPTLLLQQGRFAKNVKALFSGHNTDEGLIFTPPQIQNQTALSTYLSQSLLPDAPAPVLSVITDKLYPPETGLKTPYHYNDTISRTSTLLADYLLNCNVQALLEAFNPNVSHAYLFEEGPALHGEETPYYFYNYGPEADNYGFGNVNGTVAKMQQDWIVSFVATGNPNAKGNVAIPVYGANQNMGVMSNKGLGLTGPDPALKERCDFWQSALYY